jgi:uncharacterized protein (TIGR03083 family)
MIPTVHLFPGLHERLLEVLRGLDRQDWQRPTVCRGWSVQDIASHILDTQIRLLSMFRDQSPGPAPDGDLVAWLNRLNGDWIQATRRMSPQLLLQFLAITGPDLAAYFASLDPYASAPFPVSWAGDTQSPNWFDTGRHYTEYWHHQQQIRDAVGAPPLTGREWLHPVIALFLRALPHTYAAVGAAQGTAMDIRITGEAGGDWSLVRQAAGWELSEGLAPASVAAVELSAGTAWRLFTKGLKADQAPVQISGDPAMARVFLRTIAIMG